MYIPKNKVKMSVVVKELIYMKLIFTTEEKFIFSVIDKKFGILGEDFSSVLVSYNYIIQFDN